MAEAPSCGVSCADAETVCYEVGMLCATKLSIDAYREGRPSTPSSQVAHGPTCASTLTLLDESFESFCRAAASCSEQTQLDKRVLSNMALENYLVHFRCLFQFITDKDCGRHGDNIFAGKFLDHARPAWEKVRAEAETNFKHDPDDNRCWWSRVSKYLAHITVDRTVERANWNIEDMHKSLKEFLKRFYDALPEDRKEWFTSMHRYLAKA